MKSRTIRALIVVAGLLLVWQAIVLTTGAQAWVLPGPAAVARAWVAHAALIARHAALTATEIVLGLAAGTALGCASALSMPFSVRLGAG